MANNFRQILKSCGSLKLAVVLLLLLATASAVGTFYEARTSSHAALVDIYRSWWFNILLGALAINVTAAAFSRWPWKRKHAGFVITHVGLIVLLGGCGAAFHYGTEGMMPLRVGASPGHSVQLEEYALIAHLPGASARTETRLRLGRGGQIQPRQLVIGEGVALTLEEYAPNADIQRIVEEGGDKPNPAIRLRLGSQSMQHSAKLWLLANDPEDNRAAWGPAMVEFRVAPSVSESELEGLMLRIALGPDGVLRYASSSRAGKKSGSVKVGEAIEPGWMDLKVHVDGLLTNAAVREEVLRLPEREGQSTPALRVTARQNDASASAWVLFESPATLMLAGKPLHVGFGWAKEELPFSVVLEDFVVERDEGTDRPAGWTSKVTFHDERRGLTQRADIWMNHPGWFAGYKFSQSSWNPNDLKYTVLQVKKDPRWVTVLTWTGALLVIFGVTIQFYGRRWI